jgi:hypothetical protein
MSGFQRKPHPFGDVEAEIAPQMVVGFAVLVFLNPDLERVDEVGVLDAPPAMAGLALVEADVFGVRFLRVGLCRGPTEVT